MSQQGYVEIMIKQVRNKLKQIDSLPEQKMMEAGEKSPYIGEGKKESLH